MLTVHSKSGEAQERSADGKFGQVVVKKASGTHECPICLEKFMTGSGTTLKKHHERKHSTERNYQCAKCDYVAKTKADRDQHESMCLRGCDEGKAIVCKTCKMELTTVDAWRQHKKFSTHANFEIKWPVGPPEYGEVLDDDAEYIPHVGAQAVLVRITKARKRKTPA